MNMTAIQDADHQNTFKDIGKCLEDIVIICMLVFHIICPLPNILLVRDLQYKRALYFRSWSPLNVMIPNTTS